MELTILLFASFILLYTLVARQLDQTIITAPMLFIGVGCALSWTGLFPTETSKQALHVVAEIALILLLFLDAAKINLKDLIKRYALPTRMLGIGLPLSIILGTFFAQWIEPGWSLAMAALAAAILAPTDAALGQSIMTNPAVPEKVRRTLTVESGLNDGLALPAVLFFTSLATGRQASVGEEMWVIFTTEQLLFGPLIGVGVGFLGGYALLKAQRHATTTPEYEGIGTIALAVISYFAAHEVGGNGFIAAFVAGLTFGTVAKGANTFVYEFTESDGLFLSWAAFFLLGLALVPLAMSHLTLQTILIIATSLLVVRPLAIWLSLVGTGTSVRTRLFFGWFGPRGLATALFALLVLEQADPAIGEPILMLAVNMVWISALAHGITAHFGAQVFRKS